MAKALNMKMTVTADTSQAKKQMQELQQQLSKLGSQSYVGKGIGDKFVTDMQKARKEVAELQVSLQRAFNTDTGKLDFTKFNQQLKQGGKTLADYGASLAKLGPEGQQAFFNLTKAVSNSEIPILRLNATLKEMGTTLKNTVKWQISSSAIHAFVGAIQGAYTYAKDLNESLNNIRIVTGQSVDQMTKLADEANKTAQALGTTTTAYTDAALIYYQQGIRQQEEIAKRTETTLKLANVTKQSAEEVSSQMTAIWNNFAEGSDDLELYADKITALGAATASSSAEIAEGLSKFASVADTVGLSYDYATSALATVVAQTRQSADTVGTAFKTLFGRLEGLKLGETLEDDVDLNKYSKALQAVGVEILDENNELKEMDTILDELGAKWQTIGKEQQIALAQTVGGVRQYTQLIALMDNYDKFQENLQVAQGARGTLQKQQKIYEESWEAANKRLKASWESFYSDIIEDKSFIKLIDGVSEFVKALDRIIDRMGGIKGLLVQIAPLLGQLYNKEITNFLTNSANSIRMLTPSGRENAYRERDTFVQAGLDKAKEQMGENTAAYVKYENQIKYNETMARYGSKLSESDKEYLSILNEQNQARTKELETIDKEIEALKKRNEEAKKDFAKNGIVEGVANNNKQAIIDLKDNLTVSRGIGAFSANADSNTPQAVQVQNLKNYLDNNSEVLSKTYGEGGLGKGSKGIYAQLDKLAEDYIQKASEENPDKEELAGIYIKINELIEKYLDSVEPDSKSSHSKAIDKTVSDVIDSSYSIKTNEAKAATESSLSNLVGLTARPGADISGTPEEIAKSTEDYIKELEKQRESLTEGTEEHTTLTEKIKNIKGALETYNTAVKNESELTERISQLKEEQARGIKEEAQSNADAAAKAAQEEAEKQRKNEEARKAQEEINRQARERDRRRIEEASTASRITAVTTAVASLNAIVNTTANALDTLFDSSATGAEKFKALLQGSITILMQVANLMRGDTLAIIENTLFTEKSTAANALNAASATAEAKANEEAAASNEAKAGSEELDADATSKSAGANGLKGLLGKNLKGGTVAAGWIAAVVAAIATFVAVLNSFQEKHEKQVQNLKEENEQIKKWNEENEEKLKGTWNQDKINHQLENNIITQKEYNEQLVETAEQLEINNVDILEQAQAYDLLKQKVEESAEALKKQNYENAKNSYKNTQGIIAGGDKNYLQAALNDNRLALMTNKLTKGLSYAYSLFTGDNNNFGDMKTLSNDWGNGGLNEGEVKFLKELMQLQISGVNIKGTDVSFDPTTMSPKAMQQLTTYFDKVLTNKGAYGGADSGYIKGIEKISEDWSELKEQADFALQEFNRAKVAGYYEENKEGIKSEDVLDYLGSLKDLKDKEIELETIVEESKGYYKENILNQGNMVNTFAEAYNFDLEDIIKSLRQLSPKELDLAIQAMTQDSKLLAAGLVSTGGKFEDLTEFMQACINKIDLSNLGTQLSAVQRLLDSLKVGDELDPDKVAKLQKQYGEKFITDLLSNSNYFTSFTDGSYRVIKSPEKYDSEFFNQSLSKYAKAVGNKEYQDTQINTYKNAQSNLDQEQALKDYDEASEKVKANQVKSNNFDTLLNYITTNNINLQKFVEQASENGTQALINKIYGQGNSVSIPDFNAYSSNIFGRGGEYDPLKAANYRTKTFDTQEITDAQNKADEAERIITAYGKLQEEIDQLYEAKTNPFAYADEILNANLTLEQLQEAFNNNLISAKQYHDNLAAASLRSAEALGLNTESLKTQAEYLEKNNAFVKDDYQQAMDLSLAYQRQSEAVTDLYKNFASYKKIVSDSSNRGTEDWTNTISSLQKDMQNLFNTDANISENFILKHLKEIEKAAKNDKKAIKELQTDYAVSLSESFGLNDKEIKKVQDQIKDIKWDDIKIGMSVDTQQATQKMWNFYQDLVKDGKITQKELTQIWNSMGYELEPIYQIEKVPVYPPAVPSSVIAAGGVDPIAYNERQVIVGYKPKYTGGPTVKQSEQKDGSKKSGSSKNRNADRKDELERYYTINRQIQDQTDLLDHLSKAKDRAWGNAKLQLMDKESKALKEQIKLYEKKQKEIEKYYKKDQARMNQYGAKYDDNGVITNYKELQKREEARYNSAAKKYEKGQISEKTWNKAKARYEQFEKDLKQYDETNQLYQQHLEELNDLKNQLFDKKLEKIDTKIQMHIQVDDMELKMLEYELDRTKKKAFSTAETISKALSEIDIYKDEGKTYKSGINSVLKQFGINLKDIDDLNDKQISKLGLTQGSVDQLTAYADAILEDIKAIDQLEETILNGPLDVMKEWNEEFDYQEDKIANNISLMKQYQNISELVYSTTPGVDDQFIYGLIESQFTQGVSATAAAQAELESNKKLLAEAKASYEAALTDPTKTDQNRTQLRNNLREMEKIVQQSENNVLKSIDDTIKEAQNLLKRAVDMASDEFKKSLDVSDWDMTQFERLKTLDDQYLDDYEKIYEFSKLTRDINNSIDDTDTIRQKERLREITQEIADIEASGKEVSQYEVDALRKKYELRLAEIALEDAQAAKSTVRMSRDNDGNWSYVYTADDNNVDKAVQNYEDKLYAYQKLNSEFIKKQEEDFRKLEIEAAKALSEIYSATDLKEEEKTQRAEETKAFYAQMIGISTDQLSIAIEKNSELYHKDWLDYSENTGYKISKLEDYQSSIEYTYDGVLQPTIKSATDLLDQFQTYVSGDEGFYAKLDNALKQYHTNVEAVLKAANTDYKNFAKNVNAALVTTETESKKASKQVVTDTEKMEKAFEEVIAEVNKLNGQKLSKLREQLKDTYKDVQKLLSAYEKLGQAAKESNKTPKTNGKDKPSNSGSGGGGGKRKTGDDDDDDTPVKVEKASKKQKEAMNKLFARLQETHSSHQDNSTLPKVFVSDKGYAAGTAKYNKEIGTLINKGLLADYQEIAQRAIQYAYGQWKTYLAPVGLDTGGYTGSWGTQGRLAMLHQKELVLNAKDTENMLNTVQMVRDIVASIDTRAAAASAVNIGSGYVNNISTGSSDLNQNVHIEASFPNATDHNEIELALTNLVNRASQYAGRKTL